MLSLTLEYHIYPVALRYWIELWRTTMNAMNLAITFLLDQYYEQQYRDYTLAADKGYIGDF